MPFHLGAYCEKGLDVPYLNERHNQRKSIHLLAKVLNGPLKKFYFRLIVAYVFILTKGNSKKVECIS